VKEINNFPVVVLHVLVGLILAIKEMKFIIKTEIRTVKSSGLFLFGQFLFKDYVSYSPFFWTICLAIGLIQVKKVHSIKI
jgi:hypothetical protein